MRYLACAIVALSILPACMYGNEKAVPLGSKVGNLAFRDTHYLNRSLDDFKNRKVFVLVFVDTGCPLVKRYLPELKRLEAVYRKDGVQFLAVNVGWDDTIVSLAALAVEHDVPFPFVKDAEGKCLDALGLDAERKIRYRGRIDDQYRPGGGLLKPTRQDLKLALDELLAGKDVSTPETTIDGCKITHPAPAKDDKPVTYAEHVGPLLLKNCAGCHRPDDAAPFSLLTYEQAKARAAAISQIASDGRMPPWYAAEGHGKFINERRLSAAERDLLRRWVAAGMPKGDEAVVAGLPKVEKRSAEWIMGKPDHVLATTTFDLPAEGDIDYKYTMLPDLFLKETWLREIEILPDNPRVVHHCNLFFVAAGEKIDAGNFITGFTPGGQPMSLPEGVAVRIPSGSVFVLEIHFVATGKPEKCKLRVGMKYASGEVKRQLRFHLFDGGRFTIPAGDPALQLKRTFTLDCNAIGIGMFTHMHLRGKAMTFSALPPGGKQETLLLIPNFHFDWQMPYVLEPGAKKFPKGTKLECVAVYDNSDFNPFNPDPKAIVRSGLQTYNEMMNGFFFYVNADEDLKLDVDPKTGRAKEKSGK
jgi:mono/diheme cytochrome c family protein/peroxiredoxin